MSLAQALSEFKNEPTTDFSQPDKRQAMEAALDEITGQLGETYPLVIDGKRVRAGKTLKSINPSKSSQVVGIVQDADRTLADRALTATTRAFESWRRVRQDERAQALL